MLPIVIKIGDIHPPKNSRTNLKFDWICMLRFPCWQNISHKLTESACRLRNVDGISSRISTVQFSYQSVSTHTKSQIACPYYRINMPFICRINEYVVIQQRYWKTITVNRIWCVDGYCQYVTWNQKGAVCVPSANPFLSSSKFVIIFRKLTFQHEL